MSFRISPGSLMTAGIATGYLLMTGTAIGQQSYPDPVAAPSYAIGDTVPAQPALETVLTDATPQAAAATEQAPAADTAVIQSAAADCGCEAAAPAPEAAPCDSGCATASCGCGKKKCGGFLCREPRKKKKVKPNPCAKSHKGLFYANDFSYLNDDDYCGNCLGDRLKQIDVGRCGKLDIGGQFRHRYHSEQGMGRQAGVGASGFQDTLNTFSLYRARLYANYKVNEDLRFYAEGIYADVDADDDYIPRGIDINRGDFLNLFADIAITENTIARIGRQELLYGNQRFISPLDYANTRRTFDGVRTITKKNDVQLDMFYSQFVPADPTSFDNPDENRDFYGGYATFTGNENSTVDMYVIGSNNDNPGAITNNFSLQTYGSRIFGKFKNNVLYETEAAYQTGIQRGLDANHEAYAFTAGLGYKFANHPWQPVLWGFYDFASGNDTGDDDFNRFNDLFPLGHKYLGFIDAVARSNISSPNVRLAMTPTNRLSLLLWYHHFDADESGDIIPGVAFPTAQSLDSNDFGNEIDFTANYKLTSRASILAGYSHLFRDAKILGDTDADFFYLQTTVNF
ncbi:alginate export family protein [Mariniblastus sp.]|nr:alginate export family protein [Mariniblastus sp.]